MAMEASNNIAISYREVPVVQKVANVKKTQAVDVNPAIDTNPVKVRTQGGKGVDGNDAAIHIPEAKIKVAVEKANNQMRMSKSHCEFSYHEATKSVSIKVVDQETSEVIREIPSEKALEMFEKMSEVAGLLVDERR